MRGKVLQSVGAFEHISEEPASPLKTLEEGERELITNTLERTNWRIDGPQGAAKILNINPSTLRTRMLKLGISRPRPVSRTNVEPDLKSR